MFLQAGFGLGPQEILILLVLAAILLFSFRLPLVVVLFFLLLLLLGAVLFFGFATPRPASIDIPPCAEPPALHSVFDDSPRLATPADTCYDGLRGF